MSSTVAARLDGLPLKTLKCALPTGESERNSIESAGDIVRLALVRAGISQKAAAITMDVGEGQLTRQFQGKEHLSWQRLFKLPDSFFVELLIVIAEARGVARVRTVIETERRVVNG